MSAQLPLPGLDKVKPARSAVGLGTIPVSWWRHGHTFDHSGKSYRVTRNDGRCLVAIDLATERLVIFTCRDWSRA